MSRRKNPDITQRGINSVVVSIRFKLSDYGVVVEQAEVDGVSPAAWCKEVVLSKIHTVYNTDNEVVPVLPKNPIYWRPGVVYAAGTKVIYKGKVITAPELDADGRPIIEV